MNHRYLLTAALLLAALPAQAQPFTEVPAFPEGINILAFGAADYDEDGDLDVLIQRSLFDGEEGDIVELYRNVGDGIGFEPLPFPAPPIPSFPLKDREIAWGDYDNDGDVDVVVTAPFSSSWIYANDGGTFEAVVELPPYLGQSRAFDDETVTWADYDNDGDLDLLFPAAFVEGQRTAILFRNDDGAFTDAEAGLPTVANGHAEWGDYDNDGDLDLLLIQTAGFIQPLTPFTTLFRNDGGTFTDAGVELQTVTDYGTALLADADTDGDLDILVLGQLGNSPGDRETVARMYVNEGDGFVETDLLPAVEPAFQGLWTATFADYNNDGQGDLFVSGTVRVDTVFADGSTGGYTEGISRVYRNDGGTFVFDGVKVDASDGSGTFSWADYDGDGDLDYTVSGFFITEVVLEPGSTSITMETDALFLRNDAPTSNAAPTAPSALAAEVTGSEATFAWGPAADDHTPAEALTYNLHVRALFGSDIVSPMSRGNGTRMLPEPGNASLNTAWTLRDLPEGEYEWRVQAIDNAFNGGPFAEGGTFTVGSVSAEDGATVPTAFALRSAAPNPARGGATVRFDLPEPAEVSVAFYDVLGREVLTTAPVPMAAGAGRAVLLNTGALPAGVYVYRVEAALPSGMERASGRLTVVR